MAGPRDDGTFAEDRRNHPNRKIPDARQHQMNSTSQKGMYYHRGDKTTRPIPHILDGSLSAWNHYKDAQRLDEEAYRNQFPDGNA